MRLFAFPPRVVSTANSLLADLRGNAVALKRQVLPRTAAPLVAGWWPPATQHG